MSVRVRIAPSPTGYMHVGTARLALFNYAFARKNKGSLTLRIEDTDAERSKKEYEDAIFEGLQWLGIVVDEGPREGGGFGPYRQSERTLVYREALAKLLQNGAVFYCSHAAVSEGEHSIHWCENRDQNLSEGILRFKTPKDQDITFNDLVRGEITFNTNVVGDFSVARSIEAPLYHFAVVIDDHLMKITHVLRGEDILPSTPKHILLHGALGHESPRYGHLPLVLGPDRSKLSKRHGPTSLLEFRDNGYLSEALVNFLALIGWNPGTEQEIFSLEEFIHQFSLENIQKSGAIFDFQKLDWMNSQYIRKLSISELTDRLLPFLERSRVSAASVPRDQLERIVLLEQPRLVRLSEIGERTRFFFELPLYDKELLRWKDMSNQELLESLQFSGTIISGLDAAAPQDHVEQKFLEAIGEGDKGKILWPLRVALTGQKASPGPFEVLAVLGSEEALRRVQTARLMITEETA